MKKLFLASQFSRVADQLPWGLLDNAQSKTVGFVTTAALLYPDPWWMEEDKAALKERGFMIREIDLQSRTENEIRTLCDGCDCIFIAGGNTFFLLYHTRRSGFDNLLKELIETGIPYIGSSAGSVLLGPTLEPIRAIDDEEESPPLESFDALNMIDVVILPHHGAALGAKNDAIKKEFAGRYNLMTLTDSQAFIVEDDKQNIIGAA